MVKENNGQGRSTILRRRWVAGILILFSLLGAFAKTVSRLGGGTTKALPTKKSGATNPAALFDSHHPQERAILEGKYFLVDIDVSFGALSITNNKKGSSKTGNANKTHHYGSVLATFCPIDWRLQKTNPSSVPMFRVLVSQSKHCQPNRVTVNLREIVKKVRLYDKAMSDAALKKKPIVKVATTVAHAVATAPPVVSTPVKTLQLGGFVFHESRCGSTLVSNLLVASNPKAHRVYSESGPPITALRACGNTGESVSCSAAKQTALLQDVIYLMSRSPSKEETHVFFKIQSIGAHSMSALTSRAFPKTPWVFVYRDPVEVLMSHLKHGGDAAKKAVCLRSKGRSPPNIVQLVQIKNQDLSKLSNVEYCAAHLATLCQSALKEYHHDDNVDVDHPKTRSKKNAADNNNNNKMAKMVNYASLPDIIWESILPDHFDIDLPGGTQEMVERMKAVSQVYSKGFQGEQPWEQDSERKQSHATAAMKKAVAIFLTSYFDQMEATNTNSGNDGDNDDNKEGEEADAVQGTVEKKEEEDREATDEEREEGEAAAAEAVHQKPNNLP